MCKQATADLIVIVAQCPLSYQMQAHFLKVANNFSFHLIDFQSSQRDFECGKVFFLEYQGDQRRW